MNKIYFSYLKNRFPNLPDFSPELISEKLISPYTLTLPKAVLEQAKLVVQQLYSLRENSEYYQSIFNSLPTVAQFDPGNKSICMSYDFHIDSIGNLKLIEINTNASFLLMGYFLYLCKELPLPVSDFNLEELKKNLIDESHLSGKLLKNIAITDESPEKQRLFIEFLLYEQLFEEFGFTTQIADIRDFQLSNNNLYLQNSKIDFIYNRSTDFYFEEEPSKVLYNAFSNGLAIFSPNPHEYALLADKQRLIDWSLAVGSKDCPFKELLPIKNYLLKTDFLTRENSSDLWANRKKLFFKPLTSFGSKGTYRGDGLSRTYFEPLIDKKYLAQEFCPPPKQIFESEGIDSTNFKYDLRFYAYRDRIQLAIARLYQGQVTNLQSPLGGFSPIIFK